MQTTLYKDIESVVKSIDALEILEASLKLHSISIPTDDQDDTLLAKYFFDAINKRMTHSTWEVPNLYLVNNDEQIKLFDLMNEKFPLVTEAKKIINLSLENTIRIDQPLLLLDIGIGTGNQIESILRHLNSKHILRNMVTIIGIDPSKSSLNSASMKFNLLSHELNKEIVFYPFLSTIEELSPTSWNFINDQFSRVSFNRIINAAFSLHHSKPESRSSLFKNLSKLSPDLFTIIEPDANYLTENLTLKLRNAWVHYSQAFNVINQMEISSTDKKKLKTTFFGREIHDIFSDNSVEQYELGSSWLERCLNNGFSTLPQFNTLFSNKELMCGINLVKNDGYLSLNVNDAAVVSVLTIKSKG